MKIRSLAVCPIFLKHPNNEKRYVVAVLKVDCDEAGVIKNSKLSESLLNTVTQKISLNYQWALKDFVVKMLDPSSGEENNLKHKDES